jgi:hypothetical protein
LFRARKVQGRDGEPGIEIAAITINTNVTRFDLERENF